MNYRHCNDPHPSNFPAAATWWESYADELTLSMELSARGARAKRQTIKAVDLGELVLVHLFKIRDMLEDMQLRADKMANRRGP